VQFKVEQTTHRTALTVATNYQKPKSYQKLLNSVKVGLVGMSSWLWLSLMLLCCIQQSDRWLTEKIRDLFLWTLTVAIMNRRLQAVRFRSGKLRPSVYCSTVNGGVSAEEYRSFPLSGRRRRFPLIVTAPWWRHTFAEIQANSNPQTDILLQSMQTIVQGIRHSIHRERSVLSVTFFTIRILFDIWRATNAVYLLTCLMRAVIYFVLRTFRQDNN